MPPVNPESKVINPFAIFPKDIDGCIRTTHHLPKNITVDDIKCQIKKYAHENDPLKPMPNTAGSKGQQGVKSTYNGETFDSYWEVAFYRYMKEIDGHVVRRNHDQYVLYTADDGKIRKFYPDFEVDGIFYEVKGRFRPNDICKMQQCPQVQFIDGTHIRPMITELNRTFPKWREECIIR